ncbi:radical SAM protein [Pseudomonas protegens]|uniref:radical SAM protein n=1 Tax=Pseudomonas protegens TaxID=380021 RepID=UPI00380C02E0
MFCIYDKNENISHEIKIDSREKFYDLKSRILTKTPLSTYKFNQLYVHVPYCFFHCNFCVYRGDLLESRSQIVEYLSELTREIDHLKSLLGHTIFQSVFVGGGTVSVLDAKQLEYLISVLHNSFNLDLSNNEFTIELAPHGLSDSKIDILKPLGVNRITMGVQSLDIDLLKLMNRPPLPEEKLRNIIASIRSKLFGDFNVDLMVGVHGRNLENLYSDFKKLSDWGVESIMVYINMEDYRNPSAKEKNLGNIKIIEQLYSRVADSYILNDGAGVNEYNRFLSKKRARHPPFNRRYSTNYKDCDTFCLGIGRQAKSWTSEMVFYYT